MEKKESQAAAKFWETFKEALGESSRCWLSRIPHLAGHYREWPRRVATNAAAQLCSLEAFGLGTWSTSAHSLASANCICSCTRYGLISDV